MAQWFGVASASLPLLALPFQLRARYDLGMVGKRYGLKVVHKPSNMVRSEKWFNTEMERTAAMSGGTMERDYIYVLAEKDVEVTTDVPAEPGAGS